MDPKAVINRWTRSSTLSPDSAAGDSSIAAPNPLTRRLFSRRMLVGVPTAVAAALFTQAPEAAQAGVDGDWTLAGNALPDATSFLGSTNAQPLNMRTNNLTRMTITAAGNVGIGTAAPPALLGVVTASGTGVYGATATPSAVGIWGRHIAVTGTAPGVFGDTKSTANNAVGVQGQVNSTAPGYFSAGVLGVNNGTGGNGVGVVGRQAGSGTGVYGATPFGYGVYASHTGTTGTAPGVYGDTFSTAPNAVGVYGQVNSTSPGGSSAGVRGVNRGTGPSGIGVFGSQAGSGWGVYGTTPNGYGVYGVVGGGIGVHGRATSGTGVYGFSATHRGVQGNTGSTAANAWGVVGTVNSTAPGSFSAGVRGINNGTGGNGIGVHGSQAGSGYGVYGSAPSGIGIYGITSSGLAGWFQGRVHVNGTLTKLAGSFKIDHPLAPDTKYLSHSFVESPDMLNIYNGNVTLDERGAAVVKLPAWFEALNQDFRYQLTAIGAAAPNLHIAAKIDGNRFKIAGGVAGMEVSWQVTGVRHDAYAQAHRIPVEEDKPEAERGTYLHPLELGQPATKGIDRVTFQPVPPDADSDGVDLPTFQEMPPDIDTHSAEMPAQVP